MGRIRGNAAFGLANDQTLELIAAQSPRESGELAIFWLWFLENGTGMLFSEGNYLHPLSHNLQLIDYRIFIQSAALSQSDFSNPCPLPIKQPLAAIEQPLAAIEQPLALPVISRAAQREFF